MVTTGTDTQPVRSSKPWKGDASLPWGVRFSCSAEETAATGADGTGLASSREPHKNPALTKLSARAAVRALPAIDIDSLPKRDSTRVVYFMRASNGLVKIGQSQGLCARLRAQRSSYPESIDLLGYARVPHREIERAMHATLEKSHHHGEWFRPSRQFLFLLKVTQTPMWRRAIKRPPLYRSEARRWLQAVLESAASAERIAARLAEVSL